MLNAVHEKSANNPIEKSAESVGRQDRVGETDLLYKNGRNTACMDTVADRGQSGS